MPCRRAVLDSFFPELICDAFEMDEKDFLARTRLYSLIEPCHDDKRTYPESCSRGILSSRIPTVVFAYRDPNPSINGVEFLSDNGIIVVDYSKGYGVPPAEIVSPLSLTYERAKQGVLEIRDTELRRRRELQRSRNENHS